VIESTENLYLIFYIKNINNQGETNMRLILIGYLLIIVSFLSCNKETTESSQEMGTLTIYLTDAPAVYDSVNITFSEISAHIDDEWIVVPGDPITVDLLEWTHGNSMVLRSSDVPTGHYTQIRIKIDDAQIGVQDTVYPLTVPSGAQTGLKFGPEFTINSGSTYELVVDFDVSRSIVTTGPPNNPNGYKLKPHIRVTSMAITGSISGTISNPDSLPVAYAIQESETITSSIVDPKYGYFMLSFLPEGFYKVSVTDTSGNSYEQIGVEVIAGSDNDLGTIKLE
jgi:hypothetical protein